VNLALCREDGLYEAGGALTARWRISRVPLEDVQGIEISVLWHTEGKGDEDFHVHHFHRVVENQIRRNGLADEQSTSCDLPVTPLSYHGRLITVRWCVRLRLFLRHGREIVAEQPFHLLNPQMLHSVEVTDGRPASLHDLDNVARPSDASVTLIEPEPEIRPAFRLPRSGPWSRPLPNQ